MALALILLTFLSFFIFSISHLDVTTVHCVSPDSATTVLLGGARLAMVLLLFLSSPSIFKALKNSHRRLQGSDASSRPYARMRLYDDLLLHGYYTTRLWMGTPSQKFALIVDTGNTVSYVSCSSCTQCGTRMQSFSRSCQAPINL